jgi:hypothetical protein
MRLAKIGIRNFAKETLTAKIDKRSGQSQKFEDEKVQHSLNQNSTQRNLLYEIERCVRAKFIFYLLSCIIYIYPLIKKKSGTL